MKYDLAVVGGGPGGLMAAKTAAEDGLKVALFESKRNIADIRRACCQIFYVRKMSPSGDSETGETKRDGYIEPVSVEMLSDRTRFHFHGPGFSVDHTGCVRPYLNWIQVSPSGRQIHRYRLNERPWGFYYDKSAFVAGLLQAATRAGVEIHTGSVGLAAENMKGGVQLAIEEGSAHNTVEARAVIAADGKSSRIVESVGLNKKRHFFGPKRRPFAHYVMEGVKTDFPEPSWVSFTIPSLDPGGNIVLGLWADNCMTIGAIASGDPSPTAVIDAFISSSRYSSWFRNARIVEKQGAPRIGRTPISEPVEGNVVVVGDAGSTGETWIQGAVASGYQAVKAVKKELSGVAGYADYIRWWQGAFAFNTPEYMKMNAGLYPLNRMCTDDEIDLIYQVFEGRIGIPQMMIMKNPDLLRAKAPSVYEKLRPHSA